MRVFIGIEFPEQFKGSVESLKSEIESQLIKGRFSRIENLHLTLVFIGEITVDQVEPLGHMLDQVLATQKCFEMSIDELGTFSKGEQSIVWLGINKGKEHLFHLSQLLKKELSSRHYTYDIKPLKPHLTLVRQAKLVQDYVFPVVSFLQRWKVEKIHLYLSHQVNGILTYEPLHTTHLK
ncbi:MAG: RNA 2',3'-cyclic phosphodiesterase [Acholeplasma sp.]|jgi:2'-5' RNA ligase|nr:MAG: RNA 2',3'-cyclic phosphodiesterase [Acholeplasma sp.]